VNEAELEPHAGDAARIEAEPALHHNDVPRLDVGPRCLQLERDDLAADVALNLELVGVNGQLVAVHTFERSAPQRPCSSSQIHTCIDSGVSAA
jgi:hypothetical protein